MKNSAQLFYCIRVNLFFIPLLISVLLCFGQGINKVNDAYKQRIEGKAGEAEKLLKNIINEDPLNAIAYFELARTLNYINIMGSPEADSALQKALELEPDNVVFAYYNAKNCFLKAYISLHQGNDAQELVNNSCDNFLRVLELKSDYPEALMYLVEIYSYLPEHLGGDKEKARKYQKQLAVIDKFYGAKSQLVLMDENTNKVEYWESYMRKNGENCLVLRELGNAYISYDEIEKAKESFTKAIEIDKSQNVRLLDLARYHMMKVMQDQSKAKEELPKSQIYIDQYLNSTPDPIAPLKAFAIGMKVKTEMFTGNKEEGEKLMAKAKNIDPYFSRAYAIPSMSIFEPPTQIDHHFNSYFSPF